MLIFGEYLVFIDKILYNSDTTIGGSYSYIVYYRLKHAEIEYFVYNSDCINHRSV